MPVAKVVAAKVADAAAKAATKEAIKATKPIPGGLTKVLTVSPTLKKFLGVAETNRVETIKKLWVYVKDNQLQDPENKRVIVCDEKLKLVFGRDRVNFTEIAGLLNPHFPKKEGKKS